VLRRLVRSSLSRINRWLEVDPADLPQPDPEVDDFIYPYLNWIFAGMARDGMRRSYAWGVLHGANLAKSLGIPRISVLEFGVAGGNGLVELERIAARVEQVLGGIQIDIYGFDTGEGLPAPRDYRDTPNLNMGGTLKMDRAKLEKRLSRAKLVLGNVEATMPTFMKSNPAPVAFMACDFVHYTSTVHGLKFLEGKPDMLLPRVHCYFDDIMGFTHSDYNGERLAIHEFNACHEMRKLSPIFGLKYYLPERYANEMWPEKYWLAHLFDHPRYADKDNLVRYHRLELRTD
jgi:hypothetical protein